MSERETRVESRSRLPALTMKNIEFGRAQAVTGIGRQRLIVDGKFSINVLNSVRFGPQIQFQVYSPTYVDELRNSSPWCRTEIFFAVIDLDALIDALVKTKMRLIKNGVWQNCLAGRDSNPAAGSRTQGA